MIRTDLDYGSGETKPIVRVAIILWVLLLVPWLPFGLLAGMAFDGGNTWQAYLLVSSLWLYPVLVFVGYLLRIGKPMFVLLPILSLLGIWIPDLR